MFEGNTVRTGHIGYFPKIEIKNYNSMMGGRNSFDQPVKNDIRTYENIREIAAGTRDEYTTGCLLDYPNFIGKYGIIDLSKQKAPYIDPKAIQQIYVTSNLERAGNKLMLIIIEEVKETIVNYSQARVKVLQTHSAKLLGINMK